MSIIQQHSDASLAENWRIINIDALDPDSSQNFDLPTLSSSAAPLPSEAEIRSLAGQVRQLLRGGDTEGALKGALEGAPAGMGQSVVKEIHLQTVTEVLQSIKASDMTPMLKRIFDSEGGSDMLDTLMKYLYKGMAAPASTSAAPSTPQLQRPRSSLTPQSTGAVGGRGTAGGESSGTAMSVLLSWHEKVVEVAGLGCIARVLSDRREV